MKVIQKRKALLCAAILVAATFFPATIPHAQGTAGELDDTFGTSGVVTTDLLSGDNEAYAVAVQPDGKVCVAGRTNGFASQFGIARYLPDGQFDPTFGAGGKLVTGVTESFDFPTTMILQPDGKLIVGGYFLAVVDEFSFGLVRLNPDGQLDQSFGVNGKVAENADSTTKCNFELGDR